MNGAVQDTTAMHVGDILNTITHRLSDLVVIVPKAYRYIVKAQPMRLSCEGAKSIVASRTASNGTAACTIDNSVSEIESDSGVS
jgi:hypothetical protein